MNRILIVVVALLTLIVLGVGVYMLFFSSSPTPTPSTTGEDPFSGIGSSQGGGSGNDSSKLTLQATDGSAVKVHDVRGDHPAVVEGSDTFYYLTQDNAGELTDERYSIVYGTDSSISIGLAQEPLGASRLAAEEELRSLLGLSNETLCKLAVTVMVPFNVNEFYAGENLGLSFCPGAIMLPN